jgi:Icc-related predicted phosphoesterase
MLIPVLAISDQIDQRIYSATVRQRLGHVAMVVSCGDLPARYLEFLADALDKPVYYVLGNHAEEITRLGERGKAYHPAGAIDLGGKVVRDPTTGLILAGIPGSPRYSDNEPVQYSELQVWLMLLGMAPKLLWNRLRYGRALDVLVTHTPPRDVNDAPDPAHRGFKALRRFLRWAHPTYQLHGHIHLYDRSKPYSAKFCQTKVINVYPYQLLDLEVDGVVYQNGAAPDPLSIRR